MESTHNKPFAADRKKPRPLLKSDVIFEVSRMCSGTHCMPYFPKQIRGSTPADKNY